jgi:hypothetical protein
MLSFPEDKMADKDSVKPRRESFESLKKGHEPRKVQGGYVPSASASPITPPKGGSAAKPPPKK